MEEQKQKIIQFINDKKKEGYKITAILANLGIKRSTYYSWLRDKYNKNNNNSRITQLTPYEKQLIEQTKEEYPHLRHRQIQGLIQNKGFYISPTSVYKHLKSQNLIEPYERRPSPLKEPRFNIWRKNLLWGCDWTRLLINHIRWYLIIIIDFFSRFIIAYDIQPSVNASHVRHIYLKGLKNQGINRKHDILPELRVDKGSPNTSLITKEFFEIMGAELSYARVRRPTDNGKTERFFGTIKQEEIYLVGSYPDEISAREEILRYIDFYNNVRPHQALWNFTPYHIHEVNNNTLILSELKALKHRSRQARRVYWEELG